MRLKNKVLFVLFIFAVCLASAAAQEEKAQAILESKSDGLVFFTVFDAEKSEIAQGTGFLIGDGILATTYQLVSGAANIEGIDRKGKKVRFDGLVDADKNMNLALLKVRSKGVPLSIAGVDSLKYGQQLYALGASEVGEFKAYSGKIMQILDFMQKKVLDTTIVTTETFNGGPVLNEEGQVIGMTIYLEFGKKFVIPAEYLNDLSKTGSVTKFKNQEPVEYLETFEGINFAGKVYSSLKDAGRAEKYLKKIVEQKPDDIETLLLLASVYTEQRDYMAAISSYKKVLELKPDRDDIQLKLGEVYLSRRDWKEAIQELQKAVKLNAQNFSAHYGIGAAHQELREFDEAAAAFEKFLASSPADKKDTYSRLGECYSESEQFEKAAAAFEEALKPQPQDPALNYKYAKALQNGGQLDKASDVYYLLAQIVPDEANIYYNNVVNMFNEARLYDKAVEAAAKVAELKPQDADAQYNLGYMYIQMKKYEEAIAAFNRTLEIRPDFEFALMQLGYAYNQLKKYRDSIAAYQKLVEINPQSDNAWLNMGIGYMLLKQWDNALEPMIKTIEIKPDNGTAYYNLAICYLNLKDNVSARHVYQELKEVDAELAQRLLKYFR